MTTQEAYVDSVDQDQTAQNVQSDLWSTPSTFVFQIITESFLHRAMEVYSLAMKIYDYLFGSES